MRFAELESIDPSKREEAIRKLSDEQLVDLKDEVPFRLPPLDKGISGTYFETIEEFHAHVLEHVAPLTKPWRAHETANHEYAHAECARKLGAVGTVFVVLDSIDPRDHNEARTVSYGPLMLPRIAFAAISMHPYDATRSLTDMRSLQRDRYRSREHVIQRVNRWNERLGDELEIPVPQNGFVDLIGHLR